MKSQSSKKSSFKKIGLGLLALFFVLVVFLILQGWQQMARNGNESDALFFISSIKKAQDKYAAAHQGNFAPNFNELIKFGFLDERLSGEKPVVDGYIFEMKVVNPNETKPAFYSINADPQVAESLFATGTSHFYYDSTLGTTRSTDENRQAKANDPTI